MNAGVEDGREAEYLDQASESDDETQNAYSSMVQGEPGAQLLASDHALGNVPYLPLGLVIGESLHHHELYPEMGCTPVLVVLHLRTSQRPGQSRQRSRRGPSRSNRFQARAMVYDT